MNDPDELSEVIAALESIKDIFTNVSLSDLIVLGGVVALEDAAESAGHSIEVPFTGGRVDASQDQTDIDSVENLRPAAGGTTWSPSENEEGVFEGRNADTDNVQWTATEVDLIFGSNAELRAVAEVYAYDGSEEKFVTDFVDAWTKVMMLDRFDLSI